MIFYGFILNKNCILLRIFAAVTTSLEVNMGQLIKLIVVMGLASMVCPARVYEECDPNPDCAGKAGLPVADPTDCHAFYICLADDKPSDITVPCADGEMFDITAADVPSACIADTGCEPSCGGTCQVACNATYDLVADFNDCTHYFVCMPGGPIELACSADKPYFNGEDCTNEKTACCKPNCEMTCTEAGVQVPDPMDCHSGGLCYNDTYPIPFPCPNGCIFDLQNNRCDDSDPCETECQPMCGGSTPAGGSTAPASGESTPAGSTIPPEGSSGASSPAPGGSTTPAGTTGPCADSMECTATGFFARCSICDPSFFKCDSNSGAADIGKCAGELVFNPDPAFPYCMRPENCPFHPPL